MQVRDCSQIAKIIADYLVSVGNENVRWEADTGFVFVDGSQVEWDIDDETGDLIQFGGFYRVPATADGYDFASKIRGSW